MSEYYGSRTKKWGGCVSEPYLRTKRRDRLIVCEVGRVAEEGSTRYPVLNLNGFK